MTTLLDYFHGSVTTLLIGITGVLSGVLTSQSIIAFLGAALLVVRLLTEAIKLYHHVRGLFTGQMVKE
jgi:hypothetical protein